MTCLQGWNEDHGSMRAFWCLCIQHYFIGKQIRLDANEKTMWP